jgi:hypothetical protein
MPSISWKKIVIGILVVILLARLPEISKVLSAFRFTEIVEDFADKLWNGPPALRHIFMIEIVAFVGVILYRVLRRP